MMLCPRIYSFLERQNHMCNLIVGPDESAFFLFKFCNRYEYYLNTI